MSPRKRCGKGAAGAWDAAHGNPAALRFNKPLGQGEAETGPLVSLRGPSVELLKLDEEPLQVVGGDTDARVLYFETKELRSFWRDANRHRPAFGRELDRVRKVVVED